MMTASTQAEKKYSNGENVGIAWIPFFIGFIKLWGGLSTEVVNMVLICSSFTAQDVTKDFVAMLVLAEIDNILVGILIETSSIPDFGEVPVVFDKTKNVFLSDDFKAVAKLKNKNICERALILLFMIIRRTCQFFIDTVYFYFLPYLIMAVVTNSKVETSITEGILTSLNHKDAPSHSH